MQLLKTRKGDRMKDAQVEDCTLDAVSGLTVVDASVKATPNTSDDAESVSPPIVLAPLRDLCCQINNHHRRVQTLANSSIEYALKCGQALVDAKAQLSHGEWIPWLRDNCPGISPRQAQKYKRIAENWIGIQAKREINPEDIASVEGTLSLIAEPVSNANSNSHLGLTPDETSPHDDSMTDSNATSSRICQPSQQSGPDHAKHAAKEDAADTSSDRRDSGNPEAAGVDAKSKHSAELQPSVKKTNVDRLRLRTEIVQVCVAELNAHKNYLYVYGNSVDQELIDSIEQHGILMPLIVTSKGKVIVSGLSYWEAAKTLGIETVPVVYLEYQYEDQLLQLIVEFNRSRVTTPIQKEKEALLLNSADKKRRYREDRNRRKGGDEPAEPQE
jgi:hypothetical protein